MSDEKRTTEPHDRLTRLCDAMTQTLEQHPERGEEKCIVFLQDSERGGLVLHGYDSDTEAMTDLFLHPGEANADAREQPRVHAGEKGSLQGRLRHARLDAESDGDRLLHPLHRTQARGERCGRTRCAVVAVASGSPTRSFQGRQKRSCGEDGRRFAVRVRRWFGASTGVATASGRGRTRTATTTT